MDTSNILLQDVLKNKCVLNIRKVLCSNFSQSRSCAIKLDLNAPCVLHDYTFLFDNAYNHD